jgi:hypothetical protein
MSDARVVSAHELAHVRFLQGALGKAAVKKPTFDFKGTTSDQTTFEETATVLEDTGVQASLGSRRRSDGASLQGRQPSGEVESRDASALLSASRELTSSFW